MKIIIMLHPETRLTVLIKSMYLPILLKEIKTDEKVNWHQMITNIPSDLSDYPKEAFSSNQIPLFAILAAGTGALNAD